MNGSQTLLTKLKANNGGCSDYRVAKLLEVTPQFISNIVNGRRKLSLKLYDKIAEIGMLDKKEVAYWMLVDRAETDEMKELLEDMKDSIRH